MATTRNRPVHGHRTTSGYGTGNGNGRRGGNGYGGGGRGSRRPRKRNPFFNFLRILFNTVLFLILCGVAAVAAIFYATIKTMPTTVAGIENFKPSGRTLIYSADGTLLANIYQQNRQMVTIDKVPKDLQNATVAIEDNRFWSNSAGFDIRGIARSVWTDLRGGDITAQGGSTITQQLVRNLGIGGLTRQKTFPRKIREIIYSNQLERNYSKQQILEMYLNEVYYGSGSYGVQAAAGTYFGKTVDKLDLAQCALIAGLPQRPNFFSPYSNKDAAKGRRDIVLARMRDLGYINDAQYQQAVNEPIVLAFPKPPQGGSKTYHAPYFVDYVVSYLSQRYGSDFIYRGGIKVYTTLNWTMQQAAEDAIKQHLADIRYMNANQAALICMEPQTGYIKAMVGGVDYKKSQFNIAAYGRRQPGSSFKPVYYTAALDSGIITEDTRILDSPISLPGGNGTTWHPKNDDGRYHGWVTAKYAIAQSLNVASVKVMRQVGVETAIRYAKMMGVNSPLAPYMTLALGASAVTPLEMADVYATIDNGGARPITTPVEQITDDTGQVIEDDVPKLETTGIGSDALRQMSDMLRGVVTGGTAAASFRDDNPPDAHGKTGTTQNHLDVWFDGYTKDLVTIVWAGHPSVDPKTHRAVYGLPMSHVAWGATVTTPIWKNFMVVAEGVEQREKAREAKLHPPKKPQIVPAGTAPDQQDGTASSSSAFSPQVDPGAVDNSGAAPSGNASAPPPDQSGVDTSGSTDTGTTTVWIDNDTGQTTTPNGPNSHQETFARGYAPPQPPPADNSGAGADTNAPATPGKSQDQGTATTPISAKPISLNTSGDTAAPRPAVRMITLTVCAESGLRATKWCPETITETFAPGTAPRRYCNIHKPPPGER